MVERVQIPFPRIFKKILLSVQQNTAYGKVGSFKAMQNRPENWKERTTPAWVRELSERDIFVFGSNLAGMHGGGAARLAHDCFGAIWGQGVGLQGQSYAIPTMQGGVDTIKPYVDTFIEYAKAHPEKRFLVTRIGCGIAGFKDSEIAPLFNEAVTENNICLPEEFWDELTV